MNTKKGSRSKSGRVITLDKSFQGATSKLVIDKVNRQKVLLGTTTKAT